MPTTASALLFMAGCSAALVVRTLGGTSHHHHHGLRTDAPQPRAIGCNLCFWCTSQSAYPGPRTMHLSYGALCPQLVSSGPASCHSSGRPTRAAVAPASAWPQRQQPSRVALPRPETPVPGLPPHVLQPPAAPLSRIPCALPPASPAAAPPRRRRCAAAPPSRGARPTARRRRPSSCGPASCGGEKGRATPCT